MFIKSIKGNISGNPEKKTTAPEMKRLTTTGEYIVQHDGFARISWMKYTGKKANETSTTRIKLNGVSQKYVTNSGTSDSYCYYRRAEFNVKAGDVINITVANDSTNAIVGTAIILII